MVGCERVKCVGKTRIFHYETVVVMYRPCKDRSVINDKDRFWNELGRVVDAFGNVYCMMVMGGLVIG